MWGATISQPTYSFGFRYTGADAHSRTCASVHVRVRVNSACVLGGNARAYGSGQMRVRVFAHPCKHMCRRERPCKGVMVPVCLHDTHDQCHQPHRGSRVALRAVEPEGCPAKRAIQAYCSISETDRRHLLRRLSLARAHSCQLTHGALRSADSVTCAYVLCAPASDIER